MGGKESEEGESGRERERKGWVEIVGGREREGERGREREGRHFTNNAHTCTMHYILHVITQ